MGLSPHQPELIVGIGLGENRRAPILAWHCLQIPALPGGLPSLAFLCAFFSDGPWARWGTLMR